MKKRLKRTIAIFTVFTLFSIFREGEGGEALKFLPELKTVTTLAATAPSVSYSTHIQSYGWQKDVKDGKPSGTTGEAKRLEGIKINLPDSKFSGSVEYRTHVEKYGWMGWKSTGNMSGTTGESKRLEAIEIRLTGELAKQYDIYYRVHAQKFGWLDWAKNGESAGTAGYAYRLEAIEIKLVKKGEKGPSAGGAAFKEYVKVPSVQYQTHVQSIGWQGYKRDGQVSGTFGQAKRLEGIRLKLSNLPYSGGMRYRTHVQSKGWMSWQSNNALSGTTGEAKRLEAIEVELTGEMAKHYDVYYRVHAQTFGWLGWAKNGEPAGSEGYAKRLEGIEVRLVKKGNAAPGNTSNAFKNKNIKVEKKTVQVKEKEVAYKVTEELSPDLLKGEKEIKQKGQNGFDAVSYEVTYTNGKETNRKELSRKTTKPVNEIVRVGTKVVKVEKETRKENEVDFKVIEENDDTLELGKEEVVQEGQKGYDSVIYEVTYTNGKETKRNEISRDKIKPIDRVLKKGTKIIANSIEITNPIESIQIGDSVQLGSKILPENATNKTVVWSTTDENVISVDNVGFVTATGVGKATITVSTEDGNISDSIQLIVLPIDIESITLNKTSLILTQGDSEQIEAVILPENATDKTIEWQSSNETIAEVDGTGKLTAIKAGDVVITASDVTGKIQVQVSVKVVEPTIEWVEDITSSIYQYDQFTLPSTVIAQMSNGTMKEFNIEWLSKEIDNTQIGTTVYNGSVEGYEPQVSLTLNVEKYIPVLAYNAYSNITINGLSRAISISMNNYGEKSITINKIEVYEQGRLYSTYTASQLAASGIATEISPYKNFGMSINYKTGIWLDNSYVKFYVTSNQNEFEYTQLIK